MKSVLYTSLILLALLCPGGCPVYDFDVKTVEQPTDFSSKLNWESELNTELTQGLLGINTDKISNYESSDSSRNENSDSGNDYTDGTKDSEISGLESSDRKLQRECKIGDDRSFVGTNLFDSNPKKCFSMEDVALLTARRDFEALLPKDLPQCLLNDNMVGVFLHYFKIVNEVIQHINEDFARGLTEKAFYDTVGGYVKYYLMPVTKYSFYAGKVNMRTVDNVASLFQQCKHLLNTNGNGWKAPMKNVLTQLKSVHIEPLKINMKSDLKKDEKPSNEELKFAKGGNEVEESLFCTRLDLSSVFTGAEESQMILPLPKLEPEDCDGYLGNVWLPFKRKRSFDLRSKKSAFIVVKFYETVSRCYRFQCLCQDEYNMKFKAWISENIEVHLADDQFYPGLGAILRISENLKRGKKAASREEDYDEENDHVIREAEPTRMKMKIKSVSNWTKDKKEQSPDNDDEKDDRDHEEEYREMEEGGQFNVKVNCPVKPFNKKKKIKNPPPEVKTTIEEKKPEKPWYIKFYEWFMEKHILKYICWFLLFLLILLLLMLLWSVLRKRRKSKPLPAEPEEPEESEPTPPPPPTSPKKKRGLCDCFRKAKKPAGDDEILIKPDNPSVLTPAATRPKAKPPASSSSSSSTAACNPPRCLPIRKLVKANKDSDRSDAAIIETTSMDYSSSDVEDKVNTPKGTKPKVVTIDERKNKRSNSSAKKDENNGKAPRIGIQRNGEADVKSNSKSSDKKKKKDSLHSTSWETMYES